ncbi:amino acid permease [Candidatus Micrarchaeota archaeon]|nr:amino acid permease [Candidatus Micrarchaeota archaeon]MBD3418312.1 amino acid permease [Candidatus Micrarchaeota archaeon]
MPKNGKGYIGVVTLALMTVAALFSLSGLTENAEFGFSSIFFYALTALLFFIPAALTAAFLATRFPTGGVNVWVSNAFGKKWGLLAIWLQWIQSVTLYMTILSFAAATLAFAFNPALADNSLFVFAVILCIYWGVTLLNFRGMKVSTKISTYGVMLGTLIPGAFLILLSLIWILQGNPIQFEISASALLPDFEGVGSLVLAIGGILLYAGIEMSAAHIKRLRNPSKEYPRAIFLASAIALVVFVLGSLAIASVVPQQKISLVAGVMEAFTALLSHYSMGWLLPVVLVLIVGGTVAQINTWIAGPSRGILKVAREGSLPPLFSRVNSKDMPTTVLFLQGVLVTLLGAVFILMPDVSGSFWILTALTAQLYLIMYIMMFAAAIFHSKKVKVKPGMFRMPGGRHGVWIIAGTGLLASIAAIALGFFPPSQEQVGNLLFYDGFLLLGIIVLVSAPLLMFHFRKPSWVQKKVEEKY